MEELRIKLQNMLRSSIIWVERVRSQKISLADNQLTEVITLLEPVLQDEIMLAVSQSIMKDFELFLDAYQRKDYILAADYMESCVIEPLKQIASQIVSQLPEPETMDDYRVEYTSSAMTTLSKSVEGNMRYLHSNVCPLAEAESIAVKWTKSGISHYIIAGLGLGYHAVMLSNNSLIQVTVYEEDERMIKLCHEFSDVANIVRLRPNISIIHDPDYQLFLKAATQAEQNPDNFRVCLYHPSIQTIQNPVLREKMERLFLQMDNAERWDNSLLLNFGYNTTHISHMVDELENKISGKTVYLIAGGPSLDNNISKLKNRNLDDIVLTAGTSLKRCLQEKISPDYAIITDPKQYVYPQVDGLQECKVPMILLSTAFAYIARDYQGEKYLVCQNGYRLAEQFAREKGCRMFASGSSVVTTALDICIQLGAKRIVFLGLDLAFTGGKTHPGQPAVMTDTGLTVPDIDGNPIPTSKNLNLYREWIENRIARAKREGCRTEFIDASEGGARVKGTLVVPLSDVLENN